MAGLSYDELIKQGAKPVQPTGGVSFAQLQSQGATPYQQPIQEQPQGLWDKLKQRGSNIINQLKPSSFENRSGYKVASDALGGRALNVAGQAVGAFNDVVGAGIEYGAKKYWEATPDDKKEQAKKTFAEIIQNPLVAAGFTALQEGMDKYEEFSTANPNVAQDINNIANILSVIPISKVAKPVVKEGINLADDVAKASQRIGGVSKVEKALDKVIDYGIEKGVKPTIIGKETLAKSTQYKERAREAVKTIVRLKDNLKIKDEFGELTKSLPKNLNEFSQSVDQIKKTIFKKYNALTQQAGKAGVEVDLSKIGSELMGLTTNKVMQDIAPDVVNYAKGRADALLKRGKYTAEQAQEAISQLNKSLETFYKNPSYSEFSKLQVDALIVNNMRKALDEVIENTTEAGYQKLKNLYGSLKAIERDVSKRAIVDARKNAKGLIDFTDIFSAGDIVAGVASLNPAQIGKGVFQKAIASLYKMKNDPNRIIKKMFEGAEKSLQKIEEFKQPFKPKSKLLNIRPGLNTKATSNSPKYRALMDSYKRGQKAYDNAPTEQAKKKIQKALSKIVEQMQKL